MNKNKLMRAAVGLLTEDNLPIKIFNSPNMRALMDPYCEALSQKEGSRFVINSKNVRSGVLKCASNIRKALTKKLEGKILSLKIDSATRGFRTIFGINVQFRENGKNESHLLAMLHISGKQSTTSKKLAQYIIKQLKKYKVSTDQIITITSDNGANMCKSSRMLAHVQNVMHEELQGEEDNNIYLMHLEEIEKNDPIVVQIENLQSCRCAAHTLQLCATDVSKNDEFKNYILVCRNLVKSIRKSSNGYLEIFEQNKKSVPTLDCATRWGSTYLMLQNLMNAKTIIDEIKNVSSNNEDDMTDEHWNFVSDYVKVFAPVNHAIIKFQEEDLNYCDFYYEWLKMKLKIQKELGSNSDNVISSIANSLLASIDKREKKLMENVGLIACLFIDPRFSNTLDIDQKNQAKSFLKFIFNQIIKHTSSTTVRNPEGVHNISNVSGSGTTGVEESNEINEDSEDDLDKYLREHQINSANQNIDPYDIGKEIDEMYLEPASGNIIYIYHA